MAIRYSEFPKHPIPHAPPPPQPAERPQVGQAMVYVYEQQRWEYKVMARKPNASMSERELNTLGESGWELTGVVAGAGEVQFYFKRVRRYRTALSGALLRIK